MTFQILVCFEIVAPSLQRPYSLPPFFSLVHSERFEGLTRWLACFFDGSRLLLCYPDAVGMCVRRFLILPRRRKF